MRRALGSLVLGRRGHSAAIRAPTAADARVQALVDVVRTGSFAVARLDPLEMTAGAV